MEEEYLRGFDPLWSSYERAPKLMVEKENSKIKEWYAQNYVAGFPRVTLSTSSPTSGTDRSYLIDLIEKHTSRGIPPRIKEKSAMGYDDYNNRDNRNSQQKIDDEVRKAIEAPRIAAEIAKRVALVSSLEPLVGAELGTVLVFTRTFDKTVYRVVSIKTDTDTWAVTGDGYNSSSGSRYNFKQFLDLLTTGSNLAENIQVATGFAAPQVSATTSASA